MIKQLPLFHFSRLAMTSAIKECYEKGSVVYNPTGEHQKSLQLILREDGIITVSANFPMCNFLPYTRKSDCSFYFNKNSLPDFSSILKCTLAELHHYELVSRPFGAKHRVTGREVICRAITSAHSDILSFSLMDANSKEISLCKTIHELDVNYFIYATTPELNLLADPKNTMGDEQLWDIVKEINWGKDFDYSRCEFELLKKTRIDNQPAFFNTLSSKAMLLYLHILGEANSAGSNEPLDVDDDIQKIVSYETAHHLIGLGQECYEKAMATDDINTYIEAITKGNINDGFWMAAPCIMQDLIYPYHLVVKKEIDIHSLRLKAAGVMLELSAMDVGEVRMKNINLFYKMISEACSLLELIVKNKEREKAYIGFNDKKYDYFCCFPDISIGAIVSNVIVNSMKIDGIDYKKVI